MKHATSTITTIAKAPASSRLLEYSMLIPISLALTGVKVWMHGKAYKTQNFSPQEQKLLRTQEIVRQTVSTALWLSTLVLSHEYVSKRVFTNPLAQVLSSNIISQLPDALIRPFATAKITKWVLGKSSVDITPKQKHLLDISTFAAEKPTHIEPSPALAAKVTPFRGAYQPYARYQAQAPAFYGNRALLRV